MFSFSLIFWSILEPLIRIAKLETKYSVDGVLLGITLKEDSGLI